MRYLLTLSPSEPLVQVQNNFIELLFNMTISTKITHIVPLAK